ncbi:MAG: Nif3-like dinuclear metal center hexameric protein [Betaproteobacteria bacterium]|nr:Nif3-like dinuclear metal center hexameric protein [Betaproteobacteria bacterium]
MQRDALTQRLDGLLQPERFRDYSPNGLQVQGRPEVRSVVTGVSASLALIDAAISQNADAILVHHGLFWRGHDGRVTGWLRQRLALLLAHDIHLFAYHLPLDAHPELGNNAQLGARLGLKIQGNFGEQMLGCWGDLDAPLSGVDVLAQQLQSVCGRSVVAVDTKPGPLRRVGWCSGGAQGYFEAAIAAGVDVFITGEISEPQAHYARECGVSFIACGHHASERYGAPAVAGFVAQRLGLRHSFIDIDNPA